MWASSSFQGLGRHVRSLQIPIFVEKPLIRGPNMMDVDDFLSKPTELSDPLKHHLNPRGADIEGETDPKNY